ncbi:MAG TPA: NaeI family type II restriction endonuclease [Streptosporangiaceae bacterium]|nr:NaeI family type II restriction endonuclease [Streptosporangiaceae bacterium]
MTQADSPGSVGDGLPGIDGQLPGQMPFPGMEPEPAAGAGQGLLPGMEEAPRPARTVDDDPERDRVAEALRAADPGCSRMAAAIRGAFDLLLDGQHTGRYRWDQLHKTEKTHAGTLIEIGIQRRLGLADGTALDYSIAGAEVDCKFSHRTGGWMIPPEAEGGLLLLVQASDEDGTWSAGLVRAREEYLALAGNRDLKRALNDAGRGAIEWLARGAALPENALLRLPERDVAAIFAGTSGQQRVNELFRRALGRRISRAVVATVAMQDDYMKRVRDGGGARGQLRGEGIVIFGDYAAHQALAVALGLPGPGPGEFVSIRLARRDAGERDPAQRWVRLDGADWIVARTAGPVGTAPRLPRV